MAVENKVHKQARIFMVVTFICILPLILPKRIRILPKTYLHCRVSQNEFALLLRIRIPLKRRRSGKHISVTIRGARRLTKPASQAHVFWNVAHECAGEDQVRVTRILW